MRKAGLFVYIEYLLKSVTVFFIFIYIFAHCCSMLSHGCCVSPEFCPSVKWFVRYSTSILQCSSYWIFFWITWIAPSSILLLKDFYISSRKTNPNLSGSPRPHCDWWGFFPGCVLIFTASSEQLHTTKGRSHIILLVVSPPTCKYNEGLCRSPD